MIDAADASLDPMQAQAALQDILAEKLAKTRQDRLDAINEEIAKLDELAAANQKIIDSGDIFATGPALQELEVIGRQKAAEEAKRDAILKANAESAKGADILHRSTSSVDTLKQRFDELLKSTAPWVEELEKAQKNIEALKQGISDIGSEGGAGFGPQTPVTPGAGAMSMEQMASLARNAGFQGSSVAKIVAIAQAESSGRPGATNQNANGTTDYGLTQINSGNDARLTGGARAALDPQTAFNHAFQLSAGGSNFQPWVTYQTGAYGKYMNQASAASGGVTDPEKIKQANEAIDEQKDKILAIDQAKSGGTEIDKAQLANLQAQLDRQEGRRRGSGTDCRRDREAAVSGLLGRRKDQAAEGTRPGADLAEGQAERHQGGGTDPRRRPGAGQGRRRRRA